MLRGLLIVVAVIVAVRVVTAPVPSPPPEPVRQVAAASALAGEQLDVMAAHLDNGGTW